MRRGGSDRLPSSPELLTLLLPCFPCLAFREMAYLGSYKLDDGKPYLNNCFPAKNLLRTTDKGQVTFQTWTSSPILGSCFRPFLSRPFTIIPCPSQSAPFHLPSLSSPRRTSKACAQSCCPCSVLWLLTDSFFLAFCVIRSLTLPQSPLQPHSCIYTALHSAKQPSIHSREPNSPISHYPSLPQLLTNVQCPSSLRCCLPICISYLISNHIVTSS